jgi:hypothetical protein
MRKLGISSGHVGNVQSFLTCKDEWPKLTGEADILRTRRLNAAKRFKSEPMFGLLNSKRIRKQIDGERVE